MAQDMSNPLKGSSRLGLRTTRLPGSVVMVSLLDRLVLTAVTVSDTSWDTVVVTDESFETLGPAIADLVPHLDLRSVTGGFECRLVLQRRLGEYEWTPQAGSIAAGDVVLATYGTDGYAPLAVYSDRTRLNGARIRLVLQYHAKATGGGVAGAKAEVTLSTALRFYQG